MSKPESRSTELAQLIVEQGHVIRSMQFSDWKPTNEEKKKIDDRATRLIELAELIGYDEPEREVNERIRRWCEMNPLALGKRRVKRIIEDPASGNIDNGVCIQIGQPDKNGYYYQVLAADVENRNGFLQFTVPDSVAEYFRQQGRREIQSELRTLLNVARA